MDRHQSSLTANPESAPKLGHAWGLIWRSIIAYAVVGSLAVFLYTWFVTLDEFTVKIRPSVASFIVALVTFLSLVKSKKGLVGFFFGNRLAVPYFVWKTMNASFILVCLILGIVNLVVAYTYPTNVWVNYKIFGKDIAFAVLLIISVGYSIFTWRINVKPGKPKSEEA